MTRSQGNRFFAVAALAALVLTTSPLAAATFGVGNVGTQNDNFIIGQLFQPSVQPSPDPALSSGTTVYLTDFTFNKSLFAGNPVTVLDQTALRLAIFSNAFPDFNGANDATPILATDPSVVGISPDIIDTTPLADGAPIHFTFNNLPLLYGTGNGNTNRYAAYLVTVDGSNQLAPARVSLKSANYVETPPASGIFLPNPNYQDAANAFDYAALTPPGGNGFAGEFGGGGDANFSATFSTVVPEPSAFVLATIAGLAMLGCRRTGNRA